MTHNVNDYIAAPDDYTSAIQAAIDAAATDGQPVYLPAGTYRHDSNIYVPGSVNIYGDGDATIVEAGSFANADAKKHSWIFGTNKLKGDNLPWTGALRDLKFTISKDSQINGWGTLSAAVGCLIENCTWDYQLDPATSEIRAIIKGQNDANIAPGTQRENITIRNNSITCHQLGAPQSKGGEGISITQCTSFDISGNYIFGLSDDQIAVTDCTDGVIHGNRIYTVDSRIKLSNTRNTSVTNNHIERIPDVAGNWFGSGSCINSFTEYPNSPKPSGLTIANNVIVLPDELPSAVQSIKLMGTDNSTVSGNVIRCNETVGGALRVEQETVGESIIGCSDVSFIGNVAPNSGIQMGGQSANMPGPFLFVGNCAKRWTLFGNHEACCNSNLDD